jgi:hypothetical protein
MKGRNRQWPSKTWHRLHTYRFPSSAQPHPASPDTYNLQIEEVLIIDPALLEVRRHEEIHRLQGNNLRIVDSRTDHAVVIPVFLHVPHLLVERLDVGRDFLAIGRTQQVVVVLVAVHLLATKIPSWSADTPNFSWNLTLAAATLSGLFSSPCCSSPVILSLISPKGTSLWGRN